MHTPGFEDDRGISPLYGVVLLAGIAMVLSGVSGLVIMELADGVLADSPAVHIEFALDGPGGDLVITHAGGDALDPDAVSVSGDQGFTADVDCSAPCTRGDRIVEDDGRPAPGETVRVTVSGSAGTGDAVVGTWTAQR